MAPLPYNMPRRKSLLCYHSQNSEEGTKKDSSPLLQDRMAVLWRVECTAAVVTTNSGPQQGSWASLCPCTHRERNNRYWLSAHLGHVPRLETPPYPGWPQGRKKKGRFIKPQGISQKLSVCSCEYACGLVNTLKDTLFTSCSTTPNQEDATSLFQIWQRSSRRWWALIASFTRIMGRSPALLYKSSCLWAMTASLVIHKVPQH